jgi:hypothetical protein
VRGVMKVSKKNIFWAWTVGQLLLIAIFSLFIYYFVLNKDIADITMGIKLLM